MTHPLHSDHCFCVCPVLGERIEAIIAKMKKQNLENLQWFSALQNALDDDYV